MTATELTKLLAAAIAQGRGDFDVCVFQWGTGMEPVTALELRDGNLVVELYSNTVDVKAPLPNMNPGPDLDDLI